MFTPLEDSDDSVVQIRRTIPLSQRCLLHFNLPTETFALINATFVAVATILGTGILALPVKLSHSGMAPFSVTFTLCLFMQLATVILMVELLQRTHAEIGTQQNNSVINDPNSHRSSSSSIQIDAIELVTKSSNVNESKTPTTSTDLQSQSQSQPQSSLETVNIQTTSIFNESFSSSFNLSTATTTTAPSNPLSLDPKRLPDLHRMGRFFLKRKWMAYMFDCSVVLHFCAAMISYNLAGPEAYGDLFNVQYDALILPFWLLYVSFIVLGRAVVQPTISFLTFFKCTLFLAVLAATGAVGNVTNISSNNGWSNIMEPYLVGTFKIKSERERAGCMISISITLSLSFNSVSFVILSFFFSYSKTHQTSLFFNI